MNPGAPTTSSEGLRERTVASKLTSSSSNHIENGQDDDEKEPKILGKTPDGAGVFSKPNRAGSLCCDSQ